MDKVSSPVLVLWNMTVLLPFVWRCWWVWRLHKRRLWAGLLEPPRCLQLYLQRWLWSANWRRNKVPAWVTHLTPNLPSKPWDTQNDSNGVICISSCMWSSLWQLRSVCGPKQLWLPSWLPWTRLLRYRPHSNLIVCLVDPAMGKRVWSSATHLVDRNLFYHF